MNKGEKYALFLGMLSGDGCLSIKHNGEGYRDYPIQFYNTDIKMVKLFQKLFFDLFKLKSIILVERRNPRKDLYYISKYSKETYNKIKSDGFPEGVKRDKLRILDLIWQGKNSEKILFIFGFLITDGCIRSNNTIIFHSGSKLFLEDLSLLINKFINIKKPIREYVQREKYKSYQLNLNKLETELLLSNMPTWHNGTASALRAEP